MVDGRARGAGDVAATRKSKVYVDVLPQVILGDRNRALAHRVLQAGPARG